MPRTNPNVRGDGEKVLVARKGTGAFWQERKERVGGEGIAKWRRRERGKKRHARCRIWLFTEVARPRIGS